MPTKTIIIGASVLVVIIILFIITRPKRNGGGSNILVILGLIVAAIIGALKLFGKEEESEDAKFIREEIAEREKKIAELKVKGDKVSLDIDRDKTKVEDTAKGIQELEDEKEALEEPKPVQKKTVSEAAKKLKGL